MGMAILWVMMYHCCKATCFKLPVLNIARFGFSGVDIFFLLSGMGLCYAWFKAPDVMRFLKRRFTRIMPTYWIVLVLFHMVAFAADYVCSNTGRTHIIEAAGVYLAYPHTLLQYLSYYLGGFGFFFTPDRSYWFEWYVPTQLLFYLLFPLIAFYATSLRKSLVALAVAIVVNMGFAYWYHAAGDEGLRYLCFSRLPIFTLGVVLYHAIRNEKKWYPIALVVVSVVTMIACVAFKLPASKEGFGAFMNLVCGYRFFIIPGLCLMIVPLFKFKVIDACLTFLGTISLELYLVHIKLVFLLRFALPQWDAVGVLILFAVSIPAAWLLHLLAAKLTKALKLT